MPGIILGCSAARIGGPRAWSLANLSSGVLVFAHELRNTSTIGSAADGARVGSWSDIGPAADAMTSTGTNRPIYRAGLRGGRPLLEFDVDDLEDRFMAGSVGRTFTHAFLVAKVRKPNVSRDATIAGPAMFDQYRGAAGLNGWDGIANSSGKPSMVFTGQQGQSTWFDFYANTGFRLDGAASQSVGVERMAHLYETWRTGAGFRDFATVLGRDRNVTGSAARWRGDVRAFLGLLNPSPAELVAIRSYLGWYQRGPIIAHAGDSLRAGYGVLTSQCDAALLDAAYHGTVDCPNFAIPGQGLSVSTYGANPNMIADDPARLDSLPAGRPVAVLFVQAGTNDAGLGHSDTQVVSDLWTYCDGRRAAGWKVAVFTLIDRTDAVVSGAQAAFDAKRASINTAIRAGWAAHADILIDVAADARLGANGASANTTYFHPTDRVHISATSYSTIVLPLVQAAAESLLPA